MRRSQVYTIPIRWLGWLLPFAAGALLAAGSCETEARAWREKPDGVRRVALEQCAVKMAGQPASATASLALALGAVEGKSYEQALRYVKSIGGRLPQLADYTGWIAGQAYAGMKDLPAMEKVLSPVWRVEPSSPLVGRAAGLASTALTEGGRAVEAVSLLQAHYEALDQPHGDLLLATSLEAAGRTAEAGLLYSRIYFKYPLSPDNAKAEEGWRRLGAPDSTPANILDRAAKLLPSQPDRARSDLATAYEKWPIADQELAQVRLAATDYYDKAAPKALNALEQMTLTTAPADAERAYYLYLSARRTNNEAVAQAAFERLSKYHAVSSWHLEALLNEAYRYLTGNDFEHYEPLYRACLENFPKDSRAAFCDWKLVWSSWLRRRPDAVRLLQAHLERFPKSEKANTALYFLGRAAEQQKDLTAARAYYKVAAERYPNTYYALQSIDRATAPALKNVPDAEPAWLSRVALASPPSLNSARSQATELRLARARLLMSAGLDAWAEYELRFGARQERIPMELAMELATLMARIGQTDKGVRYIKGLLPGYLYFPWQQAGEKFWMLAFPMPFRLPLEKYAKEHEIDPYVVAGLIRQESEFNPKVISRAKAYGLTQILPSTGRELSRKVGMRGFTTAMLFDPAINLRLGIFYIRTLYLSLNSSWEQTLAAYNAGRSRVIKWRGFGEFREPAEFIETIPFNETRDYVQSVMRNAFVYRVLYEGKPLAVPSTHEPVRTPARKKLQKRKNR